MWIRQTVVSAPFSTPSAAFVASSCRATSSRAVCLATGRRLRVAGAGESRLAPPSHLPVANDLVVRRQRAARPVMGAASRNPPPSEHPVAALTKIAPASSQSRSKPRVRIRAVANLTTATISNRLLCRLRAGRWPSTRKRLATMSKRAGRRWTTSSSRSKA